VSQGRESGQLRHADDLVGHENVPDSAGNHHFGFADLLAADPDGASCQLLLRDQRGLVGLGVRPDAHTGPGAELGHSPNVRCQGVQIDQ